jgi:hypothetical protein
LGFNRQRVISTAGLTLRIYSGLNPHGEENPTISLHRKLSLASALVVTLLLTTSLLAQSPSADLLLLHGHILTVDDKDSVAQALAIRHGIIFVVFGRFSHRR